jgi:hypothetical protein
VVVVASSGAGWLSAEAGAEAVVRVVVVLVCSLEHPNAIVMAPINAATASNFLALIISVPPSVQGTEEEEEAREARSRTLRR